MDGGAVASSLSSITVTKKDYLSKDHSLDSTRQPPLMLFDMLSLQPRGAIQVLPHSSGRLSRTLRDLQLGIHTALQAKCPHLQAAALKGPLLFSERPVMPTVKTTGSARYRRFCSAASATSGLFFSSVGFPFREPAP